MPLDKQPETPPYQAQSVISRVRRLWQDELLWRRFDTVGTRITIVLAILAFLGYQNYKDFRSQNSAPKATPVATLFVPLPMPSSSDVPLVERTVEITLTGLDLETNSFPFNFESGKEAKELEAADLIFSNCKRTLVLGELYCTLHGVALMEIHNPDLDLSRVEPSELMKRSTGLEGALVRYQTFALFAYDGYPVSVRIRNYSFSELDEDGNAVSAVLVIDYVYPLNNSQRE